MSSIVMKTTIRAGVRAAVAAYTVTWRPYSCLLPISDSGKWVIGHEMKAVSQLARNLGIKVGPAWAAVHGRRQSVFIGNHFQLLLTDRWFETDHRLATAYFHGKPGQGVPEFDRCFEMLQKKHHRIDRLQVSCKGMRQVVLESGIAPDKVHLIPIGINPDYFYPQTIASRKRARERFGIPQDAVVVGSFQKDGNGWGEGLEPKIIKGPDVFIETMRKLKKEINPLVVLLSGPARGYVKTGLEAIGVPFVHHMMEDYSEVGELYQALDAYVVASREEGGPKSILESMASGIPLITTRVGQANDLVVHGTNGYLAEIDDAEELSRWTAHVLNKPNDLQLILREGLLTAEKNQYSAQLPLWKTFFRGFVE